MISTPSSSNHSATVLGGREGGGEGGGRGGRERGRDQGRRESERGYIEHVNELMVTVSYVEM